MREGEMEKSKHGQLDERGWDGEIEPWFIG
jgi:hypothetical protein